MRSKKSAIMEINKCSEKDAEKELGKIVEENQITAQDIDWTKSDGAENDNDNANDGIEDKTNESSE